MDLYGYTSNIKKADFGQVFTPLHMAEFAAALIDINENDFVLDACCGTGALLYAAQQRGSRVCGIEAVRPVYDTAKENLPEAELLNADTLTEEAVEWIKARKPTKLLLNPPYERKYKCMQIVRTVLDTLDEGTMAAVFLPDNKFLKESAKYRDSFKKAHCIQKIIKLPPNTFHQISVEASLFIIKTGEPTTGKIYTCYINDDGYETVKNKGRQDVRGKWENELRDKYLRIIQGEETSEELDAKYTDDLKYSPPEKPFEISEEDFRRTAMDYLLFKKGIDKKEFEQKVLEKVLYGGVEIKIP